MAYGNEFLGGCFCIKEVGSKTNSPYYCLFNTHQNILILEPAMVRQRTLLARLVRKNVKVVDKATQHEVEIVIGMGLHKVWPKPGQVG